MKSQEILEIQNKQKQNKFKEESMIQAMSFASYSVPVFKELKYKKWINCGPDNLWPNYLVSLANHGGIHNRIIDNKARQIAGDGLTVEDSEDKEQLARINEFLKKIGFNKKTLKRVTKDQQTFGYFFLGITWNKTRTQIANIYHVDSSTLRVGLPNKDTKCIDHYFYSEDWTQYTQPDFKPEKIMAYDSCNRIDANQIVMVTNYSPTNRYYGLPDYIGGLDAIESYAALGEHVLANVTNGLAPSLNISFNNGQPTPEEMETVYNQINALYRGPKNAGKFILSFNNSKENATTIEPIQVNNMSEVYTAIKEKCQSDIVICHGVTSPILVGITIPGQLGGVSGELQRSSETFFRDVIHPAQIQIEEVMQELLEVNGFTLKVWIKPSAKLSYDFDDSTLLSIMTVDELRNKVNLPPLSEADKPNLGINIAQIAAGGKPAFESAVIEGDEKLAADAPVTNSALRGLTPQENSDMYRIVRDFTKGKINEHLALARIQAYGIDEEVAKKILGIVDEEEMNVDATSLPKYVNELPNKNKK